MIRQYELVERVRAYNPEVDEERLNRAYVYTVQMHGTQKRASGDPYFSHPVEVAGLMTDLKMDEDTIITALLHDTVEDTLTTSEDIEQHFGPDVARLVDGVTKLSKIEAQTEDERAAENLRKFLLAISDDLRVLLVKLADRLHNMRTLHFIKNEQKRRRIATETIDIFAPLAERIGMYEFMHEMQLLAFRQLEPDAYKTITERLAQIRATGESQVEQISQTIKLAMMDSDINVQVSGREKHPYSIWRKMQERHVAFEQLTDINAFRIITDNEDDCYRVVGALHRRWPMVPGRFKDYISTPKRNGYRSIHTTIMFDKNMRVEVQIRTDQMHRANEQGLAAHWAYKQEDNPDGQAGWIRDLIEILETSQGAEEFLENTRMAMYQDRIFAFSPKGTLLQLPKGASPVDFAYAVHTDLGDKAVGAKINNRHVPLRTPLNNGDMVEILKSDAQEPQHSWLNFVVTGKARAAIRRHARSREREELIAIGRNLYAEIIARLPAKIGDKAMTAAISRLGIDNEEGLMFAVGAGRLNDRELMEALLPGFDEEDVKGWGAQGAVISIRGLTPGMGYSLGECCHPIPGDRIVGLRMEGQPVEVHTIDCDQLANGVDADWIDLSWGKGSDGGSAKLRITMHNRPGALGDVAGIFGYHKANILHLQLATRDEEFHSFEVNVEVHDLQHLMRIISALRASESVSAADRLYAPPELTNVNEDQERELHDG